MQGTLFIVATPIGNLEDITLRAIRVISEADIILSEDTRVTKKLLESIKGKNELNYEKIISYHQHSDEFKKSEIHNFLLQGKKVVLVTDAGTPGISDPGNELIDFLYKQYISLKDIPFKVVPIPGVSAVTSLLSICGYKVSNYIFLGYWPKKKLNNTLKIIKNCEYPVVFFESPYRIIKTLKLVQSSLKTRVNVCVGRELTKLHETIYRGELKDVLQKLEEETHLKGEITVVIG